MLRHHHQEKIEFLLGLAKELNFTACVAGSCVYLSEDQQPSDIDIYIREAKAGDFKEFHEQLLCLDEFEEFEKKSDAPSYGYANQVAGCKYAKFDGVEVNVLGLKPNYDEKSFTAEVISSFDYGIVQVGIDLQEDIMKTEITQACTEDRDNKTLTLLNVPSQYHLSKMGERLDKLQTRFPDHRVVITKDFYKAKPGKQNKKQTLSDNQQLEAMRAAMQAAAMQQPPVLGAGLGGEWINRPINNGGALINNQWVDAVMDEVHF